MTKEEKITLLKESVRLHEKYIKLLGSELMDAGSIAKIAGWKLKNEVEITETVVKITELKNKLKLI